MIRIYNALNAFFISLKADGLRYTLKLTLYFLLRHVFGINKRIDPDFKDVLFINGCTLPHPSRYRVDHQIEQLNANNVTTETVFYEDLSLKIVKYYRCFVFFRCPYTERVGEFIKLAKSLNKTVIFDIDDLVIDQKYTNTIKYMKTMSETELTLYNNGVDRMRKTLQLCDFAVTTTKRLAQELRNYTPEVFINRNTASLKMVSLSSEAIKKVKRDQSKIIMGYFSGSITHNDDFILILPVIKRLFEEYSNLYLRIVGPLDVPAELEVYKNRILCHKFVKWEALPSLIASVDINLSPLEDNIFNEAKSENKWVEAALVKVPTVASRVGAFEEMITDQQTGILCSSESEWYEKLKALIENSKLRAEIGNAAYNHALAEHTTIYTGYPLADYLLGKMKPNIAFVLPSTNVSGGVNVVIKHCSVMQKRGYDVFVIDLAQKSNDIQLEDRIIPVISSKTGMIGRIDKAVATLWSTLCYMKSLWDISQYYYLVQGFETDFMHNDDKLRISANSTYNFTNVKYLTVSKWCEDWLENKYGKKSLYIPNGLELDFFPYVERNFDGKIRVLIEGNSEDNYKNVDESFRIANKLERDKFEIWYLSYQGDPKEWYRYDKFMQKVPHSEVGEIYGNCHILLKSSRLESFSYPPLEMMATGGVSVVAPNCGNIEYLKDRENCMIYPLGEIDKAVELIHEVIEDEKLRNHIIENGLLTAQSRSWNNYEDKIESIYR